MAQIAESFDAFLLRIARKLVGRLVSEEAGASLSALTEDEHGELLAKIQMAARLRRALDDHIYDLIVFGNDKAETLLGEVLGEPNDRPTWKEIGDALGVSPQAAHRKYRDPAYRRIRRGKVDKD